MSIEQPKIHRVQKIVDEAKDVKTFIFEGALEAAPGQFVNVWLPGFDEKPFSISYSDGGRFGITCFGVGPFSKRLNTIKNGEKVGIRGPYGRGFTLKRGDVALVGGGCGTAPLAFLADELRKRGSRVEFMIGARSIDYLLYIERMRLSGVNMRIATDDGSCGRKCFATDLLTDMLGKRRGISMVYTCGPEIMMKKVIDICDKHDVSCEASMERYMKCGFGVCGQCCVDNLGLRVCKEGPVFGKETINQMFEFNKYKRSSSGKKMPFGAGR